MLHYLRMWRLRCSVNREDQVKPCHLGVLFLISTEHDITTLLYPHHTQLQLYIVLNVKNVRYPTIYGWKNNFTGISDYSFYERWTWRLGTLGLGNMIFQGVHRLRLHGKKDSECLRLHRLHIIYISFSYWWHGSSSLHNSKVYKLDVYLFVCKNIYSLMSGHRFPWHKSIIESIISSVSYWFGLLPSKRQSESLVHYTNVWSRWAPFLRHHRKGLLAYLVWAKPPPIISHAMYSLCTTTYTTELQQVRYLRVLGLVPSFLSLRLSLLDLRVTKFLLWYIGWPLADLLRLLLTLYKGQTPALSSESEAEISISEADLVKIIIRLLNLFDSVLRTVQAFRDRRTGYKLGIYSIYIV